MTRRPASGCGAGSCSIRVSTPVLRKYSARRELRKESRRDRLEPALVMETGENGFRYDISQAKQMRIFVRAAYDAFS